MAPWSLRKTDLERMAAVLWVLAETIRQVAIVIQPVMPTAAAAILDQLRIPEDERGFAMLGAGNRLAGATPLDKPTPVFPRFVDDEGEGA